MDALVIHFGMVNLWTKIFTVEPGTEIMYLPALRNANKPTPPSTTKKNHSTFKWYICILKFMMHNERS